MKFDSYKLSDEFSPSSQEDLFGQLEQACSFEMLGHGRLGANLALVSDEAGGTSVPIVRSTSKFRLGHQHFAKIHSDLADDICRRLSGESGQEIKFNNALVEIYSSSYDNMGFHTDMSLDLADDSVICLFSCYEWPSSRDRRIFQVKEKESETVRDILLENNSFVVFSKDENGKHLHRIIKQESGKSQATDNTRWLGITFRLSRTLMKKETTADGKLVNYLKPDLRLELAPKGEESQIYQLKSAENNCNGAFTWPAELNLTVSPGDLLPMRHRIGSQPTTLEAVFKPRHVSDGFSDKNPSDEFYSDSVFAGGALFCNLFASWNGLANMKTEQIGQTNNIFTEIERAHQFQSLTESNKDGVAFRKGIYITNVSENDAEIRFNLLRCSSNFSGPTVKFAAIDDYILGRVNAAVEQVLENAAPTNHVLAQIYYNFKDESTKKDKRAAIKAHSDKTKDMPKNGLIAFCTFYKNLAEIAANKQIVANKDELGYTNYYYKNYSILTKLKFRLKADYLHKYTHLQSEFVLPLYPDSVLLIPLSTNRIYTHEIVPSTAPIEFVPLRMGYIARCSSREAVRSKSDGATYFLDENGERQELKRPTDAELNLIRSIYLEENCADFFPEDYETVRAFTMNNGDFMSPICD